jgi:DNA-binding CsgD family transcriptional regulator
MNLLAEAENGQSRVLVVRGDAGIGKTELVESVIACTPGWRVVRSVGVEAEAELAFAALHQICSPSLELLNDLPVPQRDALAAAFGLIPGTGSERFLVGLATLSLLSAAAQQHPLICIVDDAQWLDRESAQLLAFVARRLSTDPIVMLFLTREYNDVLADLPEMHVRGLDAGDAELLLGSVVEGPLSPHVRDQIIAETQGNPLALMELPKGLSATELTVGFGGPPGLPLSKRIEDTFGRRIHRLPPQSQRLLTLAAADPLSDVAKVWRAAEALGIGQEALQAPEMTGLLSIDAEVRFRHPLVRSAAYRGASFLERRMVHQALAEASDPVHDPDRRAWHLAASTLGPDEGVATELERSAGRAQERGGVIAAATFFERSAELTPDLERQAIRRLFAAAAYLQSGAIDLAEGCLRRTAGQLSDPLARAQAMRLEGGLRWTAGRGGETPSLLFGAAVALNKLDPGLANETMVEALDAAIWAGDLTTGTTVVDVAKAVQSWPESRESGVTASGLLKGFSERLTGSYPSAVQSWNRAIGAQGLDASRATRLHLLGLLWAATGDMLDFDNHIAMAREQVRLARDVGALATLPMSLVSLAWSERLAGHLDAATAFHDEASEISVATGAPEFPGAHGIVRLGILSWQGREEQTRELAQQVVAEAIERGQGLAVRIVDYALATLELGLGRYRDARDRALAVFEADQPYVSSLCLADLVEAAARSDDLVTAQAALNRLAERAAASRVPWGLGLLARAGALVAPDEEAEALYVESIGHLTRSGVRTDLARSHLLYGEWLRRQRRRRDARQNLRSALEILRETGGGAFAQRAEAELLATGESPRVRVDETRSHLTPRELQIAQLAADGASNAEIAAQLYISPSTVEYHLKKVFAKLAITSRFRLGRMLSNQTRPEELGSSGPDAATARSAKR